MSETMIRKQVYLERAQDGKLKRLSAQRGCTESELIREAVEQLADPQGDVVAKLRAAGLLAPKPRDPAIPTGKALEALERELNEWFDAHPEGLGLGEALEWDRQDRV